MVVIAMDVVVVGIVGMIVVSYFQKDSPTILVAMYFLDY
jgi:hypothetical protein